MTPFAPVVPTLPAAHALELVELLDTLGRSSERVLLQAGLTRAELEGAAAQVTLRQFQGLVEAALEESQQPWLGLLLGLRMRVPVHGFLGFAAMTAPTLREALELSIRYAPIRTNVLRLRLAGGADETVLYIDECFDLGSARETLLLAMIAGIWRIGESLTRERLVGRADFSFATPSYAPLLAGTSLRVHDVRYEQPHNALRFPTRYLELPNSMAQASAFRLAREQCELALSALDRASFERQVQEALPRPGGGVCTVDEVALQLGISRRTLQRKLRAEGLSFSDLADAFQHGQACALLRDDKLSVEQVAERVGYSDVSNFTRAFRRWTGLTPAAYRKQ